MNSPEIIVVPTIFLALAYIIKTLSDNRLKRIMIEKGNVDQSIKLFSPSQISNPMNSVKWGLVLTGVGLALLLSNFLPHHMSDGGVVGLMSLFAGIGFFVYHFLSRKQSETDKDPS